MAGEKSYLNDIYNIDIVQSNSGSLTLLGTNTYTGTVTPALTVYVANQVFLCKFTNANTGASTLSLNGLLAKPIQRNGSKALKTGDILAGQSFWLMYDGTNFQIVGRVTTDWNPTAISLGSWTTNGASTFLNSGAGNYYDFAVGADNEIVASIGLERNGVQYDGSSIFLDLYFMKFGAGGGTIGWELDYAFVRLGDNAYSKIDGTVTNFVDVTALLNQTLSKVAMPVISGLAGADTLQLTLRRNSLGVGADTYTGAAELYGTNLEK